MGFPSAWLGLMALRQALSLHVRPPGRPASGNTERVGGRPLDLPKPFTVEQRVELLEQARNEPKSHMICRFPTPAGSNSLANARQRVARVDSPERILALGFQPDLQESA